MLDSVNLLKRSLCSFSLMVLNGSSMSSVDPLTYGLVTFCKSNNTLLEVSLLTINQVCVCVCVLSNFLFLTVPTVTNKTWKDGNTILILCKFRHKIDGSCLIFNVEACCWFPQLLTDLLLKDPAQALTTMGTAVVVFERLQRETSLWEGLLGLPRLLMPTTPDKVLDQVLDEGESLLQNIKR